MQKTCRFFLYGTLFFLLNLSISACGGASGAPPSSHSQTNTGTPSANQDHGYLYETTPQGLYQIHADSGHMGWKFEQSGLTTQLSADGQTLYVSEYGDTAHNPLIALDTQTGKQQWNTPFDGISTFIVRGESIYVASGGAVYRVDAKTGRATWKAEVDTNGGDNADTLEASNSLVYLARTGTLYAFDAASGTQKWQQHFQDELESAIDLKLVDNVLVYVVREPGIAGHIAGLDAQSGHAIWLDGAYADYDRIDVAHHLIYLLFDGGEDSPFANVTGLAAIKTDDGAGGVAWSTQFPADIETHIAFSISGQKAPVAYIRQQTADGIEQVVARSLQDGHVLWTASALPQVSGGVNTTSSSGEISVMQPGAGSDSNVYVALSDGNVYAFDANGKQLWNKQLYAINIVTATFTADGKDEVFVLADHPGSDNNFNGSSDGSQYETIHINPQNAAKVWSMGVPVTSMPNKLSPSDLVGTLSNT